MVTPMKVYKTLDNHFVVVSSNGKKTKCDEGILESILFISGVTSTYRKIMLEELKDIALSNYWEFSNGMIVKREQRKQCFITA
jgi:hypothetical protein